MRVEIEISSDISEPYAVIYTDRMTDDIQRAVNALETGSSVITAKAGDRMVLLHADEIYLIRAEEERIFIYTKAGRYLSGKRLYELETLLGNEFMRISKSAIVSLKKIASVEVSFNSMMLLVMKNGEKDYISRKYLPDFKKYLGI
jgi:DNA-binding LytR/AlgR family response regulator